MQPGHADVLRRFVEVQYVLLAPICPHFCEYVWQDLLGHKEVSVTKAPWPKADAVDVSLLKQDEYLQGKIHSFRVQIMKATTGKPKAGKAAAPAAVAKPTDVNIYVATKYSAVQLAVIELLKGLFNPSANAAANNNGFPADAMDTVKAAILANNAFKPKIKDAMGFASNIISEHKDRTEPSPTLHGETPFDEVAVWLSNLEYVSKSLEIPRIHILKIEDEGVVAGDATGKAKECIPGNPHVVAFTAEASS